MSDSVIIKQNGKFRRVDKQIYLWRKRRRKARAEARARRRILARVMSLFHNDMERLERWLSETNNYLGGLTNAENLRRNNIKGLTVTIDRLEKRLKASNSQS